MPKERRSKERSLFENFQDETETSLDSEPPAQHHSQTSKKAAREIKVTAGSLREMVLSCLKRASGYGCTDEEIARVLQMNPSTARPRRIELVSLGLVRDSGDRRKTSSGRLAVVWVVTDKGTLE